VALTGLLLAGAASPAWVITELVVRVTGIRAPLGQIGCSLFADATGFPMDNAKAKQQWLPALADGVTCRFVGVAPGRYAVSIGHDLNANRWVDTNFVGLPTEQGGSNNARPTLGAPRFDEVVFSVPAGAAEHMITIEVAE
jgi:uncharacterized protein (DUF2141 family)